MTFAITNGYIHRSYSTIDDIVIFLLADSPKGGESFGRVQKSTGPVKKALQQQARAGKKIWRQFFFFSYFDRRYDADATAFFNIPKSNFNQ